MTITGNIAVDMIRACLGHYKKSHRRVKQISLSHKYWQKFADYSKARHPEVELYDVIVFKNVTVRKGHAFMRENLEVEFHDSHIKAEA